MKCAHPTATVSGKLNARVRAARSCAPPEEKPAGAAGPGVWRLAAARMQAARGGRCWGGWVRAPRAFEDGWVLEGDGGEVGVDEGEGDEERVGAEDALRQLGVRGEDHGEPEGENDLRGAEGRRGAVGVAGRVNEAGCATCRRPRTMFSKLKTSSAVGGIAWTASDCPRRVGSLAGSVLP